MKTKSEAIGIEDLNDALNYVFPYLENKSLSQLRTSSHFFKASTRKELIRRLESELNSVTIIASAANSYFFIGGKVWGCGDNSIGQLEPSDTQSKPKAVRIPRFENIKAYSNGYISEFMVMNDGTVCAWGNNEKGQLGFGHKKPVTRPELIPGLTEVKNVYTSAMGTSTIFLKKDGTLWACGENSRGQLGLGHKNPVASPELIPGLMGVQSIAMGLSHTLFLKEDGTVWGCGDNLFGQLGFERSELQLAIHANDPYSQLILEPKQIPGLTDIKAVTTFGSGSHTIFLRKDGRVFVSGENENDQLGLGHRRFLPAIEVIPELTDVKAIAIGLNRSIFLKEDGTVWICGKNRQSELGLGHNNRVHTPQQIPELINVKAVSGSCDHLIFFKDDGSFWSYGSNKEGQLCLGDRDARVAPTKIKALSCEKAVALLKKLRDEEKVAALLSQHNDCNDSNDRLKPTQ